MKGTLVKTCPSIIIKKFIEILRIIQLYHCHATLNQRCQFISPNLSESPPCEKAVT